MDGVEHFFAQEALARAHHAAGDAAGRVAAANRMREWCAQALRELPAD